MGEIKIPNVSKNNVLLIISLIAMGYGEQFGLCALFWLGSVIAFFSSVLAIITAFAYTYDFVRTKFGAKK